MKSGLYTQSLWLGRKNTPRKVKSKIYVEGRVRGGALLHCIRGRNSGAGRKVLRERSALGSKRKELILDKYQVEEKDWKGQSQEQRQGSNKQEAQQPKACCLCYRSSGWGEHQFPIHSTFFLLLFAFLSIQYHPWTSA